ncbi:hypothetical protein [Streptomyces sp. NPDC087846]|uniref:hypothetical protein n=1 Tax=Streptomyces sp. NPDC087846 TaxID=3365807 RepID=UPI00380E0C3B
MADKAARKQSGLPGPGPILHARCHSRGAQAVERAVARHRQRLRVRIPEPAEEQRVEPTSPEDQASSWQNDRFANRIRARLATVHALLEADTATVPSAASST